METTTRSPSAGADERLEAFVEALVRGDRAECQRITESALEHGIEALRIYEQVFQPALYRIGDLWAANQISVSTEHLATAITEKLMNDLYSSLDLSRSSDRKVVLSPVEDELHHVGLKMSADVFECHGWDAVLMGPGRSTEDLLETIDREQPNAVGLSCSVVFHLHILTDMLRRLRKRFPDLPIVVGGQAVVSGEGDAIDGNGRVTLIHNLSDLGAWIDAFSETAPRSDRLARDRADRIDQHHAPEHAPGNGVPRPARINPKDG